MPNSTPSDGNGRQSPLIRYGAVACVFLIAFIARWLSSGESFWLDELHSAWCVCGSFAQVNDRAVIGNQQPFYFQALFLWWRCLPQAFVSFYGVEASLRLTSVLMTSLSAAWLTWIVAKGDSKPCLVGGVAAGLALGLERNSLFFGTELRPYAVVMFLTTAILATALRWSSFRKTSRRSVVDRIFVHALVVFAAAIHVTSLTVLGPLFVVMIINDVWRCGRDLQSRQLPLQTHGCCMAVWFVIAIWWALQKQDLWQSRGAWSSFATAKNGWDIWRLWPWASLVVLPVLAWGIMRIVEKMRSDSGQPLRQEKKSGRHDLWALTLFGVVIVSALTCYLLSIYGSVPLWHSRYLIASVPLLCAAMGWMAGSFKRLALPLSLACISLMVYSQNTYAPLLRGESRLVYRGENWKSAIAWVRETALPNDRVWIDAGLIEQNNTPTDVNDPQLEEYLRYVTAGTYRLDSTVHVEGKGRGAIAAWLAFTEHPDQAESQPRFLITRRSSSRLHALPPQIIARRFGSVTVLIRQ